MTNRTDHLGKGRGNECEVELAEFYEIIEWFVCSMCCANTNDMAETEEEMVKAETIGDLLASACACELRYEDPLELIDYERPIGGTQDKI